MPSDTNSDYFTARDSHSNQDIINCLSSNSLSFLNCNMRSLQASFDNLVNMLSELYFPVSVTGVTETKLKNDREIMLNINITAYSFLSQPSYTNAGDVGFYIKNNLGYIHRSDLSAQVQNHCGSKFKMIQGTTPFVGFPIGTPMVIWITS